MYIISVISKPSVPLKKWENHISLYLSSASGDRRGDNGGASTGPHRAPTGPQGAVRQPYQNGNAQRNQIQTLHFSIATAKPNF